MNVPLRFRPFLTLYYRELCRFNKVLVQTVFTPLVSSALYLLIFGVSLGKSIIIGNNLTYLAFIIPGLVMMAVLNNAYQNSSSSVVNGKSVGDLEDWRISPISVQAILWALAFGGLTRGLLVGLVTFALGQLFYYVIEGALLPVAHPIMLMVFLVIGGLSFAMFGISVAFWAKTFDHLSGFGAFVVTPLIYLGGVFYSLEILHPFWRAVSRLNPLLYFVNGVRYGLLGVSDVGVETALLISLASLLVFWLTTLYTLKTASYSRW